MSIEPLAAGVPAAALPGAVGACDPLLAAVAGRLDEGLLIVDARTRALRYANPVAVAMLGVAPTAAGTALEEAVGDYRLSVMLGTCLAGGAEANRELGDPAAGRHVVARALPAGRGPDGRPEQVVFLLRDESRMRRLETVRRDFVANVSHELRTPIAAIQLLVETLQDGALTDPSAAAEFVGKIGLEVGHMAQVVSELLELSTFESGGRTVVMREVAVAELLEAAERLRPLADERRLELRAEVPEGVPAVRGDAAALAQVVRNLVHNAIKFTPPGGRILLTAREVAEPDAGPGVELRVADTGCGIPAGELARIFERFYKADKSRQRDGEGTGLGLAIARHTVEQHGGSLGVESEPGRGSTFWVRLRVWDGA